MRSLFQRLNNREQSLLIAVIWVAIFFWASQLLNGYEKLQRDWRKNDTLEEQQQIWFDKENRIEASLEHIYKELDPKKTFNPSQLAGKVETLAREHNLNYSLKTPQSENQPPITIHKLNLIVSNTTIEDLLQFEKKLQSEKPYIALSKMTLKAGQRDREKLAATFVINAFELSE